MTAPAFTFEAVTHHAKGAWPRYDGFEMTHSGEGTTADGQRFTVHRHYGAKALVGSRTEYYVYLVSAKNRELTATKWDAIKADIRRAFVKHVRYMVDMDMPRPYSFKPEETLTRAEPCPPKSDESVQREAADELGFGTQPVTATPVVITIASVEAVNARNAKADDIASRHATLGAVWKARLDVKSGVAADEGDWKYVGTPLHAVYLAAHKRISRFKLHAFIEQDYNPNHRVRVSRYVDLSKPALPPRPAATVHDFPPAVARVSVARDVIEFAPSWAGVLPVLLAALEDGTQEGKRMAREELARMAKVADMAVAQDAAA